MAGYSTNFTKRGAYAVNQGTIMDLTAVVDDLVEEAPTIKFKLEQDHEIESKDAKEAFDDVYVKNKYIKSAEIQGFGVKGAHASITFGPPNIIEDVIGVRMGGDREACVAARAKIESILQGSEQWYSKFMFQKEGYAVAFTFAVPVLLLAAFTVIHLVLTPESFEKDKVPVLLPLEWLIIWAVLVVLKGRMFPKIVFDIGKSASVGDSARSWRNVVGIVIAIGVPVAVAGGLIVERLLK